MIVKKWEFNLVLEEDEGNTIVGDNFRKQSEIVLNNIHVYRGELQHFHSVFQFALFNPITTALESFGISLRIFKSTMTLKEPDFICDYHTTEKTETIKKTSRNVDLTVPFIVGEIKLPLKFSIGENKHIVDSFKEENKKTVNAVNQLHTYMVSNSNVEFGILSTFEKTWVFKKGKDRNELFISQCFRKEDILFPFLVTIVNARRIDRQRARNISSNNNSAINNNNNNNNRKRRRGDHEESGDEGDDEGNNRISKNLNKSLKAVDANKGNSKTSSSSSKLPTRKKSSKPMDKNTMAKKSFQLFLERIDGDYSKLFHLEIKEMFESDCFIAWLEENVSIFVKSSDMCKHIEKHNMLINENEIYKKLESLQGTSIPLLLFSGMVFAISFGIVTTDCGTSFEEVGMENISMKNRQQAVMALQSIHQLKVLHGDVALRNILQSDDGEKVTIIDFEMSHICDDEDAFQAEEESLRKILGI